MSSSERVADEDDSVKIQDDDDDFPSNHNMTPTESIALLDVQFSDKFIPIIERLQQELAESKTRVVGIIEEYERKLSDLQQEQQQQNEIAPPSASTLLVTTTTTSSSSYNDLPHSMRKSWELHQEQLAKTRLEKEKQSLVNQVRDLEKTVDKLQFNNIQHQRNIKNIEREKSELEKQIQSLEKTLQQANEKFQKQLIQSRKDRERLLSDNRDELQNAETLYQDEIRQLKTALKKEQEKSSTYKSKFEDQEKQLGFVQYEFKQKIQQLESDNRRLSSELKSIKQLNSETQSNVATHIKNAGSSNLSTSSSLESPRYYSRYNNLYY